MMRGEIWWAILPSPAGKRPIVLVSRNEAYKIRDLITIAPVTTRIRGIPTEVELNTKDGLPRRCVVNCDNLTTIPKTWLEKRISVLHAAKMREVDASIKFALGI